MSQSNLAAKLQTMNVNIDQKIKEIKSLIEERSQEISNEQKAIKSLIEKTNTKLVIFIDALASSSIDHLNKVIQITTKW